MSSQNLTLITWKELIMHVVVFGWKKKRDFFCFLFKMLLFFNKTYPYSYNKIYRGPRKFCENDQNAGGGWQLFLNNAGGERVNDLKGLQTWIWRSQLCLRERWWNRGKGGCEWWEIASTSGKRSFWVLIRP